MAENRENTAVDYIKELKLSGFKRIARLTLSLKPLNVIIGVNGVGKTSLLEALSCLNASAKKNLSEHISSLGGYLSLVSIDSPKKDFFLQVDCLIDAEVVAYEQHLTPAGVSYAWSDELVSWITAPSGSPEIQLKQNSEMFEYRLESGGSTTASSRVMQESGLSQVRHSGNKLLDRLAKLLSGIGYYHSICIEPNSPIRIPQPIKPTALPGANGEDLISCLYNIRIADRARFELVEDTLRAAFPSFEYIDFPPVAAGMLSMLWKDKQFTQPLYPHQLSEGTLRFLWLTALLYSPELPAVTLIDEPEVSLHPRMLSLLADMLREASQRAQIIVATQSESLVRFMQPEEVLVMDLDEAGHTTAMWADEMNLGDWLEDYTLDELWQIGRLGGRD